MSRPRGVAVFLMLLGGCSGGTAIDRKLVCSATESAAYSRVPDGPEAWDWPAVARAEIERAEWSEAGEELIRGCGQGIQPRVVGLAFSADRKLALITRSSFADTKVPETDPTMELATELEGAIESCLLRRERVLTSELWQPVACKLDAVS